MIKRRGGGGIGAELAWLSLEQRPGALRMSRSYAERLLAAGFDAGRGAGAPYLRMPDGPIITPAMRCAYRDGLIAAELDGSPGAAQSRSPTPQAKRRSSGSLSHRTSRPRQPGSRASRSAAGPRSA